MAKQRIYYLDNIRILFVIVILIHLAIIYGSEGGWYYKEVTRPDAINQAFFLLLFILNKTYGLGFFFMMSGLFTAVSLKRKSIKQFIPDRLLRLGIPLVFYALVLHPIARSLKTYFIYNQNIDWLAIFKNNIIYFNGSVVGPLWFVELLLIFTFLFIAWVAVFPNHSPLAEKKNQQYNFPKDKYVIALIVALSIISFVVRIWFPFGYVYVPLSLDLADLPQYTAYFIIGLYLPRNKWLALIDKKTAKRWFITMISLIIFMILGVFIASIFTKFDMKQFAGGLSWQSAIFSAWEITYSFAVNIALFYFFRVKVNKQGKLAQFFSKNIYAAFVFHPLVITLLALLLKDIHLYPMVKYLLVAPIAVFASFGFGHLVRIIPGMNKIL